MPTDRMKFLNRNWPLLWKHNFGNLGPQNIHLSVSRLQLLMLSRWNKCKNLLIFNEVKAKSFAKCLFSAYAEPSSWSRLFIHERIKQLLNEQTIWRTVRLYTKDLRCLGLRQCGGISLKFVLAVSEWISKQIKLIEMDI